MDTACTMSSGSRDLASEFLDDFFGQDEVFSMPILDGAPGNRAELGFGDGAGVSSLNVVLQWQERAILEALEVFVKVDTTAQGIMGVYAEAAPQTSAVHPACMHFSVPESWPNTGGLVQDQLATLAGHGPALAHNMISFRRSVKRRRAPGRCIPHAGPLPTPGTRRRRRRVNVPNTGSIFEHRPEGMQSSAANTSIIVEDLRTVLRHPFDASIIPVAYSVNTAHEPQAKPTRARHRAFSAPPIDSTSVTVPNPIRPVQEAQDPTAVPDSQNELPALSVKNMECYISGSDQLSFDETIVMNSTYGDHAHDEALPEPTDMVLNADSECQVNFYNPNSTTLTAHGPAQQAERVPVMGLHHGCALGADKDHPIHIDSSSASFDCAICDADHRGPIDSVSSSANRFLGRAAHADAESFDRPPRLTWTPELVSQFESAIAFLGGPAKATPKAIQRCMGVPGVTILNVKSRLQKFRMQAGVPVDTSRCPRRNCAAPRVTRPVTPTSDEALVAEEVLHNVYETCREWSDRLEVQNDQMRHLLAEHHKQTQAANYNAMVLEMYAARIGAAAVVPNFDQVETFERNIFAPIINSAAKSGTDRE